MPKALDSSSSESSKRLLPGQLCWLWLTGVVIALDQITKHMVVARFDLYERLEVMPFFNLTLAYNPGAAFSFLADAGGWQRWFFTAIALGASVLILIWLARLTAAEKLQGVALALILGGAWAISTTGWCWGMWWIFWISIGVTATSRPSISPTALSPLVPA